MAKVSIVKKGEVDFNKLYSILMENPEIDRCGAVVMFMGIVRGYDVYGNRLSKLIYDADPEIAIQSMEKIRKEIIEKYDGVKEIVIYHVIDELNVSEPTIYVLVAAEHREEAFKAAKECIDRVKAETPIWKKEVSEGSEHWITGESIVKMKEYGD